MHSRWGTQSCTQGHHVQTHSQGWGNLSLPIHLGVKETREPRDTHAERENIHTDSSGSSQNPHSNIISNGCRSNVVDPALIPETGVYPECDTSPLQCKHMYTQGEIPFPFHLLVCLSWRRKLRTHRNPKGQGRTCRPPHTQ